MSERQSVVLTFALTLTFTGQASAQSPSAAFPASDATARPAPSSQPPEAPSPALPAPPAPAPAPQAPSTPALTPAPAPAPALAAHPSAAEAPPPADEGEPQFGDQGQIVLTDLLDANLGFLSYDNSSAAASYFGIEPAIDYFFKRDLSLGASAFLRYSHLTSGDRTATDTVSYGLHARFGGNVRMGKLTSFRPLIGLGVWRQHQTSAELGDVHETAVVFDFFAPILLHLAPHFFVGLGPEVYHDLSHTSELSRNKRTFIGVASVVGGWF